MTLNFGDFVKTESGDVFRVIHTESVTNDGIDVRTVDRYGGSDWVSSTKLTPLPDYTDFDGPKPVYVSWTFETMPDSVKVQLKSEKERKRVARPWTTRSASVSGTLTYYAGLLEEYEQLDGSPCGQLKNNE